MKLVVSRILFLLFIILAVLSFFAISYQDGAE